jgi:ferritin-like metal-binding protein YciE
MAAGSSKQRQALLDQHAALAKFGALALRSDDLNEILTEACRLVGDALHTDLAKVMELQSDGQIPVVRAGVGWSPGVVGCAKVKANSSSSEGFALDSSEPVISEDINTEDRFAYPDFLKDNGVKAMVNVIIIGAEGKPPYGILEVDSRQPRRHRPLPDVPSAHPMSPPRRPGRRAALLISTRTMQCVLCWPFDTFRSRTCKRRTCIQAAGSWRRSPRAAVENAQALWRTQHELAQSGQDGVGQEHARRWISWMAFARRQEFRMATPQSPQDILTTELKEIYSAERQLTRAIPKLSKRVQHPRLKEMLQARKDQGETLLGELDDTFDNMDITKGRPKNVAAEGLLEDINQHLEEIQDNRLLEPVLIAGLQKLEHYCIAAWGTARSMGRLLGEDRVIKSMERVLKEGKQLDEELTRLAEEEVNPLMLNEQAGSADRGKGSGKSEGARAH